MSKNRNFSKLKANVMTTVKSMVSMRTVIGTLAGGAGIGYLVKKSLNMADTIAKTADRIGITTKALQEWRHAARLSGLTTAELDKGLEAFAKRLGEARAGTGTLITILNKMDPALLANLRAARTTDDALMGNIGWLTTPGVRGHLKTVKADAGSGIFLMNDDDTLLGYRFMASTQVPSNLSKGASSGILHAAIFANWTELLIGQWGGIDLVIDPYTAAKNAQITMVINGWYDIAVKHPESFVICDEIDIS